MTVKEAINSRYSNRYYKENQLVERAKIEDILRAGQKAPNGLGLEAWKFYVIESQAKKEEMKNAAHGQQQFADASFVIALTAPTDLDYEQNPEHILGKLRENGLSEERIKHYTEALDSKVGAYLREQTFFAAAQMVLQARELGIDSCIVGGYNPLQAAEVIGVNGIYEQVTLLITFGYHREEPKERYNKPLEKIVKYL